MKAMIDKDGNLSLSRSGEMKEQFCPFDPGCARCGDWCPLFQVRPAMPTESVQVSLCHGKTYNVDLEWR